MKTRAAVLRDVGKDWEVIELELDPPKAGEVLVRFAASGMCHSDDHLRTGDIPVRYPIVGGHEGAGVVEDTGPGVTRVEPGDHVVCSFLPVCGHCRFCAQGMTNLCDLGALLVENSLPDGTFRFHADGEDFGQMCLLGTFSERAVISEYSCVRIDDDLPLEAAALVGCGVPTGWGTAVHAGGVRPGDTTIVYGVGGVGINAVQGAANAGARNVIAVDPVESKRAVAARLGATHTAPDAATAARIAIEVTNWSRSASSPRRSSPTRSPRSARAAQWSSPVCPVRGRTRSCCRASSSRCWRSSSRARCSAAATRSRRSR